MRHFFLFFFSPVQSLRYGLCTSLSWIKTQQSCFRHPIQWCRPAVVSWHDRTHACASSPLTSAGKDHKGKYSVPTLDVTSQQLVLDAKQTLRLSCRWVSGRSNPQPMTFGAHAGWGNERKRDPETQMCWISQFKSSNRESEDILVSFRASETKV